MKIEVVAEYLVCAVRMSLPLAGLDADGRRVEGSQAAADRKLVHLLQVDACQVGLGVGYKKTDSPTGGEETWTVFGAVGDVRELLKRRGMRLEG